MSTKDMLEGGHVDVVPNVVEVQEEASVGLGFPAQRTVFEVRTDLLRAFEPLDVMSGYGDSDYLKVIVGTSEVGTLLEPLDRFWREQAMSHDEARRVILRVARSKVKIGISDLVVDKVVDENPSVDSLSMLSDLDMETAERRQAADRKVRSAWETQGWYKLLNSFDPRFAGEYSKAAVMCPHAPSDKEVGEKSSEDLAREALLYMIMQPKVVSDAFHLAKGKEALDVQDESTLRKSPKRMAYLMDLLAGRAAFQLHASMESDRRYPSPSVRILESNRKEKTVRDYLDALLSLLLSPGYIAQSDLITKDIEAVLDLYDSKYGLRKDYDPVLRALSVARSLQGFAFVKDRPELTASPIFDHRWTLDKVLSYLQKKFQGGELKHLDIGSKDDIGGQIALLRGKISQSLGIDVFSSDSGDIVRRESRGGAKIVSFNDDAFNHAQIMKLQEIWTEVEFGGGEALHFATYHDSLHHIDDTVRLENARLVFERLVAGGVMEFYEPIHVEAIDMQSEVYVHPFDTTFERNTDTKMVSMEDLGWLLAFLSLKGARFPRIDIIPGVFAGNEDGYYRLHVVAVKGGDESKIPYAMPKDPEGDMTNAEDVFRIFPFSLIGEKEVGVRSQILEKVKVFDFARHKIAFADFRQTFMSQAMRVSSEEAWESLVLKSSPVGDYLDDLFDRVGEDEELKRRNTLAGEALLVMNKLVEMGIDLSSELELKHPHSWGHVILEKPPVKGHGVSSSKPLSSSDFSA